MEEDVPRLTYNPDDGSIVIRPGGPSITVESLVGELSFERMTPTGESATPLWLDSAEVDVLIKMVRYILDNVAIRETSRQTLQALLPRLEMLAAESSSRQASD